jgi:hypothetical protein
MSQPAKRKESITIVEKFSDGTEASWELPFSLICPDGTVLEVKSVSPTFDCGGLPEITLTAYVKPQGEWPKL